MADYERRVIASTRHEYVLASPTNPAEFGKAYAGAKQQAESLGVATSFDDWLTVSARDDEVVLHFTVERPVST